MKWFSVISFYDTYMVGQMIHDDVDIDMFDHDDDPNDVQQSNETLLNLRQSHLK